MFHLKNGSLPIDGTTMDYIRFGKGNKHLIILPGLSDGLATVKGKALVMQLMYGKFTKGYTAWSFSRKNQLPSVYTTSQMADDLADGMEKLGIDKADVIGISQGGMIAQHLAIRYPERVNRLVLGVSTAGGNGTIKGVVDKWIKYARNGDYKNLMIDTTENSYSEKYLKKYRPLYPILTRFGKPKTFDRFLTMADACITHDTREKLQLITASTLVIGGGNDHIVGPGASTELAQLINGSKHILYPELGHAAYEEAKDFFPQAMAFLNE